MIFQDRKQDPEQQLLSSEKFCIICINQLRKKILKNPKPYQVYMIQIKIALGLLE